MCDSAGLFAFAKVFKMTYHSSLKDSKLTSYCSSFTCQIFLYGLDHGLWIQGFNTYWPFNTYQPFNTYWPCLIVDIVSSKRVIFN